MINSIKIPILFFSIFTLSLGCKTTGGIFGNKIKSLTPVELNKEIRNNIISFQSFSSKSKIDVSGPDINQSVSAQIDMVADSMIGISLRVIGIEGARMMITPDSVHIIDRLNQTYLSKGFDYIHEQFALEISFADLQNLIAGNPVFYDSAALSMGVADDKYVLFSKNAVYKNSIWLSPAFELSRMFIEDLAHQRNMTLTFSEFDKIEGKPFAFNRTILIDAQADYKATIEFSKVTLNEPVEFTFSINPKYKKIE